MSVIMNDDATFQDMIYYSSPFQHNKEVDVTQDFMNNRFTFTELLSEPIINESYDFAPPQQQQGHYPNATPCSSPESDYGLLDAKIKIEDYDTCQLYTNPARSLSIDSNSCPELAVCNPANISVASIDSPPPTPTQQHHQIQEIYCCRDRLLFGTEFVDTASRGMHHPHSLIMQEQDYQSIVTPLPSPPTTAKAPGKSRGRRMSNKPTKPGTKCFECTYAGCGRIFKRSEHLKRHVRSIHTLERPFHCPYAHCSKRFSRSDNLSQHIRVHRPNGKDKHQSTRMISNNFTPFLQTYHRNGTIHSSISN